MVAAQADALTPDIDTAVVAQPNPLTPDIDTAVVAQPNPLTPDIDTAVVAQPNPLTPDIDTAVVAQPNPLTPDAVPLAAQVVAAGAAIEANAALQPPAQRGAPSMPTAFELPGEPDGPELLVGGAKPMSSAETTANLDIDIEALERSYLDSLTTEPTADTATLDTALLNAAAADRGSQAAAYASFEATAIDNLDIDTVLMRTELSAVVIHQNPSDFGERAGPAVMDVATLDYDLLDLDATTQHVQMPSELNDHPLVAERRMNIVDVLKIAIDRDPHRRDLRMKLLETYYSAAASNQRAFMDVVRKLAREREFLSPEDWQKVMMMGRAIAADDILFAGEPSDALAHCA